MIGLIFVGFFVGILSGFFGIGGGTVLIPSLLLLGYDMKVAIGISVVQMVFGSIYGSYLNNKKGTLDIVMVLTIGLGGFVGALFSGVLSSYFSAKTLEGIFLFFAIFALFRLYFKQKESKEQQDANKFILFSIGLVIGSLSMTIGIGGSILLVPILVGFLHIPLKKATSAGLFFVVFSSVSGLISHLLNSDVDYVSGIVIGFASLLGVYLGIELKHKVDAQIQKKLLVVFYASIVLYLSNRIIFSS
jgi:uncharacterized membrane protein YfcA